MRITTNSIMRQYGNRINNALIALNKASNKVATGLKYGKSAEAPAESAKATRLYAQKMKNDHYLTNLRDTIGILDNMEGSMSTIRDIIGDACINIEIALNDASGGADARNILAADIRQMQQSILSSCNIRVNDQYLFGGSGTQSLPISMDADGNVLYRGIDVNDSANEVLLKKLAEEKIYVDLGFGLTVDKDNNVTPGTAFDRAMPAISFLGYGTDAETGYPENILSTMSMVAEQLEKEPFDHDETSKLWAHLKKQFQGVNISITQIGTNSKFLEATESRLKDVQFDLEENLKEIIGVDSAAAITEMQYQQYVYNAVLKMGTSVLTPSFIDFMK